MCTGGLKVTSRVVVFRFSTLVSDAGSHDSLSFENYTLLGDLFMPRRGDDKPVSRNRLHTYRMSLDDIETTKL